MEIGPIFRALLHSKSRFALIVTEIALTLAIVSNCFNMIADQQERMNRPTGIDVDNILVVNSDQFAEEFQEKSYRKASFQADLSAIRAMPGVAAAASMHHIPLSGSGSATSRRVAGSEQETLTAPYFIVSLGTIETLGLELIEGRDFLESDMPPNEEPTEEQEKATSDEPDENNVILTRALADRLFPDGGALGNQIASNSGESVETIVGIVKQMKGSWPLSSVADSVMLYPGDPFSSRRARYVIRAEPGMMDNLYTSIDTRLLELNDGRIIKVRTMNEVRAAEFQSLNAINKMLSAISGLLVLVTSLGIVGLTAFSVTQRTRQIGTRRALGATRFAVVRYFLVENWVITTVGLLLGVAVTYSLNYVLAQVADLPIMDASIVTGAMALLWGMGLVAALAPALRGSSIAPVIATRTI